MTGKELLRTLDRKRPTMALKWCRFARNRLNKMCLVMNFESMWIKKEVNLACKKRKNVIARVQQEAKSRKIEELWSVMVGKTCLQDELCYYRAVIEVYFSVFGDNDNKDACLAAALSLVVRSTKKQTNNGVQQTVYRLLVLNSYKAKRLQSFRE